MHRLASGALALLLSLASPLAAAAPPAAAVSANSPSQPGSPQLFPHALVAAANPLAVAAGLKVLRAGGSAVDAAVAIQAVLGLVEPQSSGIGGGGFMVYYDAKTRRVTAYDGRETAPRAASPGMFLDEDGKPLGYFDAVLSGRSTGAPGVVAMLALAHREHGSRPWRELFGDAEALADKGFVVSPRLADFIAGDFGQAKAPDIAAYFTKPDGTRYAAGDVLRNPAYARTLRRLAEAGPRALYTGPIAADIVARVRAPPRPGGLTLADLAAYRPKESPALCRPYRVYVVCTPRDPSGGSALLEALGLLQRTDIASRGPGDPKAWFEFIQATRLMYADRDRYNGDPGFVSVPTIGLLDPAYLKARAALIGDVAGPAPAPGAPPGAFERGADHTAEPGGTSHFVVADAQGNVVSMTTSVESVFGDGRMVDGFILNNQLTDFSREPDDADGAPAANAAEPGKRPRSAMSPVIVLDGESRLVAALGSPGGPSIIAYNLKALVGLLDWKLTLQQAFALPNVIARGDRFDAEADRMDPQVVAGLAARGVRLSVGAGENSGLHGLVVRPGGYEGAADPRREGVAEGF
ncbi:MAG: gamma-glutamyltransferase family protein [Caulobacteraceae bacterium]|nr:gamma-glutamyltransferase family protein [Caulobacteraceae bacterium]